MSVLQPQLWVIAGPNGSGKTSFARQYLPRYAHIRHFVNADLIAAGLSPFDPDAAALRAGRLMLAEIRRLADQRMDFAFETTLSGKSYAPLLRNWRDQGYVVSLSFLWLPRVELNVERVADRVRKGGHNIPEADIRRRYGRSIYNFLHIYQPLADNWILFDNSGSQVREIAFARAQQPTILDAESYRRFTEAAVTP